MVVVGFFGKYWEYFFFIYTGDFCISGLTTVHPLCYRIFVKLKVVILIEK